MKQMKFSIPYDLEIVRFETSDHLRILREICGETISYGIRGRRPTLKERPIPLAINDTLNNVHMMVGVDGPDELEEDQHQADFIKVLNAKQGGIDLAFNMRGDLSIRIRYEKVMYTDKGDDLPTHLHNLCTTYHWGPLETLMTAAWQLLPLKFLLENCSTWMVVLFGSPNLVKEESRLRILLRN
jgi:hypothetical protein